MWRVEFAADGLRQEHTRRVTKVYITRTGEKYHVDEHCSSFADAERQNGRPIQRWSQDLRGLSHSPCQVCWPTSRGYDAWRQFEMRVEQRGDSPYEAMFVDKVLRHIPGLRPADIAIQQRATGSSGRTYYLDFVISPEDGHRVAVEIDGRDKAPGSRSVQEVQSDVDRKRADLINNGWRMLNFSTERVSTKSDECVSELRAELRDAVPSREGGRVVDPAMPASGATATTQNKSGRSRGMRKPWVFAAAALAAAVVVVVILQGQGEVVEPRGDGNCPTSAPIKGNVSAGGEKIFHAPGWEYYERTAAEECFESEEAAIDAGYRASEVQ